MKSRIRSKQMESWKKIMEMRTSTVDDGDELQAFAKKKKELLLWKSGAFKRRWWRTERKLGTLLWSWSWGRTETRGKNGEKKQDSGSSLIGGILTFVGRLRYGRTRPLLRRSILTFWPTAKTLVKPHVHVSRLTLTFAVLFLRPMRYESDLSRPPCLPRCRRLRRRFGQKKRISERVFLASYSWALHAVTRQMQTQRSLLVYEDKRSLCTELNPAASRKESEEN